MANLEILALDTAVPQIRAPGAGDGYSVPRDMTMASGTTLSTQALTAAGNLTLSGGTANGVLYLNASKVATSGSALVFDGTNLGIGTTSPQYRLDLQSSTAALVLRLKGGSGINQGSALLGTYAGSSSTLYAFGDRASLFGGTPDQLVSIFTGGPALTFDVNGGEKARIDSSGNLGIGTASPGKNLEVAAATDTTIRIRNTTTTISSTVYGTLDWATSDSSAPGGIVAKIDTFDDFPGGGGFGDRAALRFFTNNSTALAERMRLDSSGNLGLGVTPSAWSSSAKAVQFGNYGSLYQNASGYPELAFNTFQNASNVYTYSNTDVAARYSQTNGQHQFFTAPSGTAGNAITFTQAMTLDASGNLGLGTTSPTSGFRLDIQAATARQRIESTTGTNTVESRKNNTGGTLYSGIDSNGGSLTGVAYAAYYFYSGNYPLIFGTNNAERARITAGGDFLTAGKTSASYTTVGAELLANGQINTASANLDNLNIYNTTAAAYRFYVNSGGTVFATNTTISAISDQRLKENIRDLDAGLDAVMALKPRKFDWKEGKGKNIKDDRGWIAQEFEQVFPDMIDTWKDQAPDGEEPYKSVRADLIPVLVKAIQEQQAMIETLKARLAALEAA